MQYRFFFVTIRMLLLSIACWVLLVFLIQYHWNKRHLYKLSWSMHGPVSLPIIGDGLILFGRNEDILDAMTEFLAKYASPIKFWFGPKFAVIFKDINHIEKVMSSMKFAYKDNIYRFIQAFNGQSLISGSGPKWKSDRKLISPLLADKRVEKYLPICIKQSNILIKVLEEKVDKPTFDSEDILHRCAADIVTAAICGMSTQAQTDSYLDEVLHVISDMYILVHSRIAKVWLQNEFIFTLLGYKKQQERGKQITHGFFRTMLENAKSKRKDRNANTLEVSQDGLPESILEQILTIREEIPQMATDLEMVHHISTFYTASEDTIMTICCFTLVILGMYPEIQEKVVEEVKQVVGPFKRDLVIDDVKQLKYLEMCVRDVLRLFPIAPFIMRQASEDCQIDKWTIPKGCSIIISIYNVHRDPLLWERPNEFYPEHFLPEAMSKRHPYAFLPFSAGPRGCIGKPFAYMAIKSILATILQHYRIEADGTLQDKPLKTDISVRFKEGGYPIRIKKRQY